MTLSQCGGQKQCSSDDKAEKDGEDEHSQKRRGRDRRDETQENWRVDEAVGMRTEGWDQSMCPAMCETQSWCCMAQGARLGAL